jgi:hypothetical protein
MGMAQNVSPIVSCLVNSGIHRFSPLVIPTKYKYQTGITILMLTGRFLDPNIDIDYRYPCIHLYTGLPCCMLFLMTEGFFQVT